MGRPRAELHSATETPAQTLNSEKSYKTNKKAADYRLVSAAFIVKDIIPFQMCRCKADNIFRLYQ
jgi:hypothetical protein